MRLSIESTDDVTIVDGRPARVWKGRTEGGIECFVFVARIAVREDKDDAFARELLETHPPAEDAGEVRFVHLRDLL